MKYKVGDKVKIRTWDSMKQEYVLIGYYHIKILNETFTKGMKKWCSKVVTIDKVYSRYYRIKKDIDRWNWTDEMIDHAATRILSIIDRLEKLRKLTNDIFNIDIINEDIRILKSDKPGFSKMAVDYYNKKFQKWNKKFDK